MSVELTEQQRITRVKNLIAEVHAIDKVLEFIVQSAHGIARLPRRPKHIREGRYAELKGRELHWQQKRAETVAQIIEHQKHLRKPLAYFDPPTPL